MLNSVIEMKESLSAASVSLQNAPNLLTNDQWDVISECVTLFESFDMTINFLQKNPTILSYYTNKGLFSALNEATANTVIRIFQK